LARGIPITDYGCKNDGKHWHFNRNSSAIDSRNKEAVGKVIVSSKGFPYGPQFSLGTGVELHLKKEAILLGSTTLDYKGMTDGKHLFWPTGQKSYRD